MLPSLVSLVFAFNGLSCLCFHPFFAFETFHRETPPVSACHVDQEMD